MPSPTFTPLTPPSYRDLTENTAIVGGAKHPPSPADLLASFERSFAQLDSAPHSPALVVATSGSTGKPKQTLLTSAALAASARATETFTGADKAQWLLALPVQYVAGAQVLVRSALAGTQPVITRSIEESSHFSAQDFVDSAGKLTSDHRLTSLVPTQLHKLFEAAETNGGSDILDALRSFTAILLGGAPASAALLKRAEELSVKVLTTYGSAETAGGCVYSGQPLPGVLTRIEPENNADESSGQGRIWLGGPTLASGYLDDSERTAIHFFTDDQGNRWYKTDDRGYRDEGLLHVLGRADDTVITGGLKISAGVLARTLEEHESVREAMVFGLDDARWGQALTAAITLVGSEKVAPEVLTADSPLGEQLVDLVTERMGKQAVPKLTLIFEDFPLLTTGKPDRQAIRAALAAAFGQH
ncbi:MAG: AMP-binding protein [Rothia sp. (in: high G+C Gram-positive bacteria)]|nr:AMP-binding protein [Rothia sp. (in: high G+C Gram-positive bacteria)]